MPKKRWFLAYHNVSYRSRLQIFVLPFSFSLEFFLLKTYRELLLICLQEQVLIGSAEVRAIFSSGSGRVAGCMVSEGKLVKGCGIRVIRDGKTVHVGVLDSLRRVKEIVKEV